MNPSSCCSAHRKCFPATKRGVAPVPLHPGSTDRVRDGGPGTNGHGPDVNEYLVQYASSLIDYYTNGTCINLGIYIYMKFVLVRLHIHIHVSCVCLEV